MELTFAFFAFARSHVQPKVDESPVIESLLEEPALLSYEGRPLPEAAHTIRNPTTKGSEGIAASVANRFGAPPAALVFAENEGLTGKADGLARSMTEQHLEFHPGLHDANLVLEDCDDKQVFGSEATLASDGSGDPEMACRELTTEAECYVGYADVSVTVYENCNASNTCKQRESLFRRNWRSPPNTATYGDMMKAVKEGPTEQELFQALTHPLPCDDKPQCTERVIPKYFKCVWMEYPAVPDCQPLHSCKWDQRRYRCDRGRRCDMPAATQSGNGTA